jgi:hypothetical protein
MEAGFGNLSGPRSIDGQGQAEGSSHSGEPNAASAVKSAFERAAANAAFPFHDLRQERASSRVEAGLFDHRTAESREAL